jgi:hypothetical protein
MNGPRSKMASMRRYTSALLPLSGAVMRHLPSVSEISRVAPAYGVGRTARLAFGAEKKRTRRGDENIPA